MDEAFSIHRHEPEKAIAVPTSKLAGFSAGNAVLSPFLLGFCTIRQFVTGVGFPLIAGPCRWFGRCQFFVSAVFCVGLISNNCCLAHLLRLERWAVFSAAGTAGAALWS